MSCKALKLSGCEVAGSTFQGRKFTFTDRQINEDTFFAKVYNFQNTLITEIQGVKNSNDVYFSFGELENQKIGSYKIEYWANIKDIAIEIIAIESFKISSEPCDCDDSNDVNYTLEFKEETVSYSLSVAIVNIGWGGSGGDGKSAYEIAVENGFVGTEAQWLASLKGKDGKDGENGKDGTNGRDGRDGIDGVNGKNGTDGKDGYTPVKGVDYNDGAKGEPFRFSDFTPEQLEALKVKGDKGEKGDPGTTSWAGITDKPSTFTPPAATATVLGGVKIWTGTQATYDAITTKQSDVFYYVS
ncbi:MAG: phage upper tail fiber protein [Soonwooa sp.]